MFCCTSHNFTVLVHLFYQPWVRVKVWVKVTTLYEIKTRNKEKTNSRARLSVVLCDHASDTVAIAGPKLGHVSLQNESIIQRSHSYMHVDTLNSYHFFPHDAWRSRGIFHYKFTFCIFFPIPSYLSSLKPPLLPCFMHPPSYSDLQEHIARRIISLIACVGGTFTVTRNLGTGFTVPYAPQWHYFKWWWWQP